MILKLVVIVPAAVIVLSGVAVIILILVGGIILLSATDRFLPPACSFSIKGLSHELNLFLYG